MVHHFITRDLLLLLLLLVLTIWSRACWRRHGGQVGDALQLLARRQLGRVLLVGCIGLHLRCSQHLPQEGLQLGVHLWQRLLQRGRLNALISSILVLVCHLYENSHASKAMWHSQVCA